MITAAIHQPQYLPWLAYLDKADQADVFVFLDTVQYMRRGVQNRNRIKNASRALWLTVPVTAAYSDPISKVAIAAPGWSRKHVSSLRHAYARARHADRLDGLVAVLERPFSLLADLNVAVTSWLFAQFGVGARTLRASELAGVSGAKDELIIALCRAVGATRYLSGPGARAYQSRERFEEAGVELVYQSYEPRPYAQCHPALPFLPGLSAVDTVLNEGPRAREVMLAGRRAPTPAAQLDEALVDPVANVDEYPPVPGDG